MASTIEMKAYLRNFLVVCCTSFFVVILTSCEKQPPATAGNPDEVVSNETPFNQDNRHTHIKFTSMVRAIFEDSKGNFWFGSDLEGVCRYDGETFRYFTTDDGLSHNQIRTIQEDKDGFIWFATGNGVSRYNGKVFTTHTSESSLTSGFNAASDQKIASSDLWFNGELEGGIYRYNGQNLSLIEFPVLESNHESFSISGTVTGISRGKDNMIWIANYQGVIGYNGESFSFINERGFDYHVRSILEDSQGNLWIGNNGIGVLWYNGNETIKLSDKKELSSESSQNYPLHVFTIAEGKNSNIWFGDRDTGAWKYDGTSLTNYTVADGLPNLFVRVMYMDRKGQLWAGLADGGVAKFNGKSFEIMF